MIKTLDNIRKIWTSVSEHWLKKTKNGTNNEVLVGKTHIIIDVKKMGHFHIQMNPG